MEKWEELRGLIEYVRMLYLTSQNFKKLIFFLIVH